MHLNAHPSRRLQLLARGARISASLVSLASRRQPEHRPSYIKQLLMQKVKLVDCPRDAMQGYNNFIPTALKVEFLNALLQVGFDTLDFGSFVSPKAIPQMRDTAEVLSQLDDSPTSLLAIVANERGAEAAASFERVAYLGYPFSISQTFQQRNTNASIEESLTRVEKLQNLCVQKSKTAVIYISMAFGNPYGEHWHPDIAAQWCERLTNELDIKIIALSDTIGVSTPEIITDLFKTVHHALPKLELGVHLHTTLDTWKEKVDAAYTAGCRRYDGALKGYGGCPMATDKLTGNMPTELMVKRLEHLGASTGINDAALSSALTIADRVFTV